VHITLNAILHCVLERIHTCAGSEVDFNFAHKGDDNCLGCEACAPLRAALPNWPPNLTLKKPAGMTDAGQFALVRWAQHDPGLVRNKDVRLSVEQWRPPAAGELHTFASDTLRCQCLLHITHTDFNGKSLVLPFRWGGVLKREAAASRHKQA